MLYVYIYLFAIFINKLIFLFCSNLIRCRTGAWWRGKGKWDQMWKNTDRYKYWWKGNISTQYFSGVLIPHKWHSIFHLNYSFQALHCHVSSKSFLRNRYSPFQIKPLKCRKCQLKTYDAILGEYKEGLFYTVIYNVLCKVVTWRWKSCCSPKAMWRSLSPWTLCLISSTLSS